MAIHTISIVSILIDKGVCKMPTGYSLSFFLLLLAYSLCIFSCIDTIRDFTPPFSAGFGPSGVFYEGPVVAGSNFGLTVALQTDYYLNDIEVRINLPPEVEVEKFSPEILKKFSADDLALAEQLKWTGSKKPRTGQKWLHIALTSKTDWKKWSRPIEVHIGFDARGADKNAPWPDGHYRKTMTWSHEGYKDSDWEGPDRTYR